MIHLYKQSIPANTPLPSPLSYIITSIIFWVMTLLTESPETMLATLLASPITSFTFVSGDTFL